MKILIGLICGMLLVPSSSVSAVELLERVRHDAGLCIVIDDIPSHRAELRNSELWQRVKSLSLYRQWLKGGDFQRLSGTLRELEQILGSSVPEALLNFTGPQAVVAVYPQAEKTPAGLLLLSPQDSEEAGRLLDLWHLMESAEVVEQPDGYWRRTTHKATLFYLLTEGLFAISDREELIKELAQNRELKDQEMLIHQPQWNRAMDQVSEESWIRAWFCPTLWGGVVKLPEMGGLNGLLLQQLKRAESLVAEITTTHGLQAGLHLMYFADREPLVLQNYRAQYPPQQGLFRTISSESLFLISGRGGFEFLGNILDRNLIDGKPRDLAFVRAMLTGLLMGKDPYRELLPALGDRWSVEVSHAASDSELPVELLLDVALEDEVRHRDSASNDNSVSLKSALENLLRSAWRFLAVSERGTSEGVVADSLPNGLRSYSYSSTRGWKPTFVVSQNRLLLGSSQEQVQAALLVENTSAGTPRLAMLDEELASSQFGWFVDIRQLRESISQQRGKYLHLLKIPAQKREPAQQSLQKAVELFQLFDGGYGFWQCREAGWSLWVGGLAQPE